MITTRFIRVAATGALAVGLAVAGAAPAMAQDDSPADHQSSRATIERDVDLEDVGVRCTEAIVRRLDDLAVVSDRLDGVDFVPEADVATLDGIIDNTVAGLTALQPEIDAAIGQLDEALADATEAGLDTSEVAALRDEAAGHLAAAAAAGEGIAEAVLGVTPGSWNDGSGAATLDEARTSLRSARSSLGEARADIRAAVSALRDLADAADQA